MTDTNERGRVQDVAQGQSPVSPPDTSEEDRSFVFSLQFALDYFPNLCGIHILEHSLVKRKLG